MRRRRLLPCFNPNYRTDLDIFRLLQMCEDFAKSASFITESSILPCSNFGKAPSLKCDDTETGVDQEAL